MITIIKYRVYDALGGYIEYLPENCPSETYEIITEEIPEEIPPDAEPEPEEN